MPTRTSRTYEAARQHLSAWRFEPIVSGGHSCGYLCWHGTDEAAPDTWLRTSSTHRICDGSDGLPNIGGTCGRTVREVRNCLRKVVYIDRLRQVHLKPR
jgi:hypothetical protein